jgi:hypothetical protein
MPAVGRLLDTYQKDPIEIARKCRDGPNAVQGYVFSWSRLDWLRIGIQLADQRVAILLSGGGEVGDEQLD